MNGSSKRRAAALKWLDDTNLAMSALVLPGSFLFGPADLHAALQNIPEDCTRLPSWRPPVLRR